MDGGAIARSVRECQPLVDRYCVPDNWRASSWHGRQRSGFNVESATITLRMYAARKRWPLQGVHINLSHAKIHAEDCADCSTERCLIDHIEVEMRLMGEFSDEQRRALLATVENYRSIAL
jgi:hypothetical protein